MFREHILQNKASKAWRGKAYPYPKGEQKGGGM